MNGVQRFLSRRDKKRPNGELTHPTKDAHRILHIPSEEKRKTDKDEEKKTKDIIHRLQLDNIVLPEWQVEDVLRLPSINGNVDRATALLRLYNDAAQGKIHEPTLAKKMVGAVNRENVTCYLDSLLFSMFARTDSFEGILSAQFPDEPRKRLVLLLRLWVNMLRSGMLITTDITQKLQESLKECGWDDAALLRQQDVSEAFGFITGKLDLPLLTLKMDVYHTGKEDRDDHRIVRERLLDVAIPEPSADGTTIRLEDCLEQYFNNKIEVKRHLQRRNTVQTFRPNEKEMGVETFEIVESPMEDRPMDVPSPSTPSRPEPRRRGQSIFTQRQQENPEDRKTHDDIGIRGNRSRAGTLRREVLMPAWQFFSLIPWGTHDQLKNPKTDEQVIVHLQQKRPVLGICLKRYSMSMTGVGSRLDTYIDIPVEIGVPHFISDDYNHEDSGWEPNFTNFKMSLLAVICHRGKSLDAGHYIALIRGQEDKHGQATEWLRFDDSAHQRIITVDIDKALKEECPYLLFYQVRPNDDDEDGEILDQCNPPSYDEATTDTSNGGLSRVPTRTDLGEQDALSTARPSTSGDASTSDFVVVSSPTNTQDPTQPPPTAIASDPEIHLQTSPSTTNKPEPRTLAPAILYPDTDNTTPRAKSMDLAALDRTSHTTTTHQPSLSTTSASANTSKASLEIPRGRSSFQGSRWSTSNFLSSSSTAKDPTNANANGNSSDPSTRSVPVTPADESKTSWLSNMGGSRRNSITKGWLGMGMKPRSRPSSQSGEGRLSMSMSMGMGRLKSAMSKDRLAEAGSGGAREDTAAVPAPASVVGDAAAAVHPDNKNTTTTSSTSTSSHTHTHTAPLEKDAPSSSTSTTTLPPRRSKSLRHAHKKGKWSSSGNNNSGGGGGNGKDKGVSVDVAAATEIGGGDGGGTGGGGKGRKTQIERECVVM